MVAHGKYLLKKGTNVLKISPQKPLGRYNPSMVMVKQGYSPQQLQALNLIVVLTAMSTTF